MTYWLIIAIAAHASVTQMPDMGTCVAVQTAAFRQLVNVERIAAGLPAGDETMEHRYAQAVRCEAFQPHGGIAGMSKQGK